MDIILPVFGLAFLGSIAGLLGGIILLSNKRWGKFLSIHAVAFAAGVLLTVSLLDLLPEAIQELDTDTVLLFTLLAMVTFFFLEQFISHFHHHEEHKHNDLIAAVPLVLFGDTIHNFLDGVAIASSFLVEPRLGVFVALATFLHEIPQEIGDFGILISSGWSRIKVILFNLVTACATFLGAGIALFFSSSVEMTSGFFLAVTAGLFLYIAATDLLPKIGQRAKDERWHQSLLFLIGVLFMVVITKILPD